MLPSIMEIRIPFITGKLDEADFPSCCEPQIQSFKLDKIVSRAILDTEKHRIVFCFFPCGANYFSRENTTDVYQHTGYMQRMFEVKNSGDTTIIITIFSVSVWHIDRRRRQRVANFCLGTSMNPHNFIFLGILSCSSN